MKAKIIFLVFALIPYLCNAQSPQILSGKVLNRNGSPTGGYSIILLSPKDSSLCKGDFFFDPNFSVEVARLPVLLRVSSFGFRDTTLLVQSAAGKLQDIYLSMESYTLNEVVVRASQPMFNMKNDRMTLNVAGTLLSESGSAADVLQKAARVKVNESGISVLGAGDALILVDGRELSNYQALESLSSSEIRRVDIITNPSAKYDAKGKAVIEIRTKGAKSRGLGAEITARMSKGAYWTPYIGTEISAKTGALFLYGFYAFSPDKKFITESYIRDYTQETPPVYGLIDMESVNKTTENHRIRLSGDYAFSGKHRAGVELSGQFREGNNSKNEISRMYNSANTAFPPVSELTSIQQTPFTRKFLTGTAYYAYESSPEGVKLTGIFDKSRYDTGSNTRILEYGNSGPVSKQNNVGTTIDITSFKTDISIPLPKGYTLETGLKFSHARNQSNTFFSAEGNTVRNINYEYKENTGALYFLLSGRFGKCTAGLGTRVEVSGNYAISGVAVQDTTAWNLFPSLDLNYNLAKNWDLGFSYAMKISRPTFQDLNPAIDYVDSLTYFQGNPGLVPEIRHAFTLKLVYLKVISLGVSYTRKNNLLAWYIEQDPSNSALTRITQKNINTSEVLSIDAMLPYQNKWLSCYLSTGLIYTVSNDKLSGVTDLKHPMWYAYSGFDFTLPHGFRLSTNIRYFTKGLENVFYFNPVFRMDAGIRKSFLQDQLTAGILWNDIFKTDDMNTYTTIRNRYIGYTYYYDRSSISFSLTYRFNFRKNKYQSRSSIGMEKQRIKGLD